VTTEIILLKEQRAEMGFRCDTSWQRTQVWNPKQYAYVHKRVDETVCLCTQRSWWNSMPMYTKELLKF